MTRVSRWLRHGMAAIVVVAFLFFQVPVGHAGQDSRSSWLQKADMIFAAKVLNVHEHNFEGLPLSHWVVSGSVESVIESPHKTLLEDKDQVTIKMRKKPDFQVGDRIIFYTRHSFYGQGIGVREVGHEILHAPLSAELEVQIKDELKQIRKLLREARLRERIKGASIVLAGEVEGVRAVETDLNVPVTLHDPNLQEAVIRVEEGLKGAESGQRLSVLFPDSSDILWLNVPRLEKGQKGVFLLREYEHPRKIRGINKSHEGSYYVALHPLDVLAGSEIDVVRKILEPVSSVTPVKKDESKEKEEQKDKETDTTATTELAEPVSGTDTEAQEGRSENPAGRSDAAAPAEKVSAQPESEGTVQESPTSIDQSTQQEESPEPAEQTAIPEKTKPEQDESPEGLQEPATEQTEPSTERGPSGQEESPREGESAATEPGPDQKDSWVINLASFTSRAKADQFSEVIRITPPHRIYVSEFTYKGKQFYRVRAGFYRSKEEAARARDELSGQAGLAGAWLEHLSQSEVQSGQ